MTKPHKRRSRGQCVFCGAAGVTKEHIWSDWLKAILPSQPQHTQNRLLVHIDQQNKAARLLRFAPATRQGAMTQRKTRNVCRQCNSGWMGQLVERAKPLSASVIQDQPCQLLPAGQIDLAGWIAVAAIMAEFTDVGTSAIPETDRKIVRATSAPPPSWTIYIGRYAGVEYAPFRYRHDGIKFVARSVPSLQPEGETPRHIHVTTNVLGSLLIHAFSATDPNIAQELRQNFTHKELVCIWPSSGEVISWPSSPLLGDEYVNALHDKIMNLGFRSASQNP